MHYRMHKIIDPETQNEYSVTLTQTSITAKQSDVKYESTAPQDVSAAIKLNQENLMIVNKNLVSKCDANGNTNPMENSVEYSDGSVYPNYYRFEANITENVIIMKDGVRIDILTTDTSSDLIEASFNKVSVSSDTDSGSLSSGATHAYVLNEDTSKTSKYEIFVNEYRVNAEKVYVTKDSATKSFDVTTLVVSSDNVTESDSEGNTLKRYYLIGEDELIPIWEAGDNPIEDNKRYADGDVTLDYYRIVMSDYDMKYINPLVNNTDEEMRNGGTIAITTASHKPVSNIFTSVENVDPVFIPLNSSAFKFDDIYYTNVNNMIYLPFGALREIGSTNITYVTDGQSSVKNVDKSMIFNDVLDRNIVMTFDSNKIAVKTRTEKSTFTEKVYTPTSEPLNRSKYGTKPYYVKNFKGDMVEINTAAMKYTSGTTTTVVVADIDNTLTNDQVDYVNGRYVASNISLFSKKLQKYLTSDVKYNPATLEEGANYYKYSGYYFYFDSSTRYEKVDSRIEDPNGDYLFYDRENPTVGMTYPDFYPDGLVQFNRSDKYRKYYAYSKIDDSQVNGNYVFVGDLSSGKNDNTRDENFIPVKNSINRVYKHTEYTAKGGNINDTLLDGLPVTIINPDGSAQLMHTMK